MAVTSTIPWCVDKAGTGFAKQSFTSVSRTTDAEPNPAVVPLYTGELILDTSINALWKALTPAANSWVVLTTPTA